MKKITLLALLMAGALCASAATPISKTVKNLPKGMSKTEQVARVAAPGIVSTNYQYVPTRDVVPEGYASVTLVAGDVWQDGSGYQMLLDADATAYGTIIPETGGLTTSGDASAEVYAEFEYKIPENADGALATTNIIMNGQETILIPAGVYDYCITNPTVGDRMWITSNNGGFPGRGDDYEFQSECAYVITISLHGSNDGAEIEIEDPTAPAIPTELAVVPGSTTADVTWTAGENNPLFNLRYRQCDNVAKINRFLDLPNDDEILDEQLYGVYAYDADGDNNGWGLAYTDSEQTDLCFYSASYYNYTSLDPDNWLLFPVKLGGSLKFNAMNYSSTYLDNLGVFVCPNKNYASLDEFVQVGADFAPASGEFTPYEFDLSNEEWNGKIGWVAIRHYNSYDMYTLYVDDIEITVPDPDEELMVFDWTVVEDLDEASYNIDGLTPETDYEVQVQGVNRIETRAEGDKVSDWTASVEFTTLAEGQEAPVYYVLGFNDWNNPIEIGEDGATVEVEAQNFEDANDTAQEFKIVTPAEDGGWIWYGGEDANGAGFFDLTDWMDSPITLYDDPAPAVQNFRLPEAGTYTIKLVADRAALAGLKMIVTKETVVGIDTIKSDVKGDNNYYNLMGQKVSGNLPAGIYIHNGKKIVVK